jgi:hypothetical protein
MQQLACTRGCAKVDRVDNEDHVRLKACDPFDVIFWDNSSIYPDSRCIRLPLVEQSRAGTIVATPAITDADDTHTTTKQGIERMAEAWLKATFDRRFHAEPLGLGMQRRRAATFRALNAKAVATLYSPCLGLHGLVGYTQIPTCRKHQRRVGESQGT